MKNFLFDLYGTLADIQTDEESEGFWNAVAGLLKKGNGKEVKRLYRELCEKAALPALGEFDLLEVMRYLTEEFGYDYPAERLAEEFRRASVKKLRLYRGVRGLLGGLRSRGARVFLLSNAQACFTRPELLKLGLSDSFDGIILSSEAGWKKPSLNFFKAAFEKFSLSPENCIYIGNDLYDDVYGARLAGMRSVYIQTVQSGIYAGQFAPDLSVKTRKELKELLFRLAEE